MLLYTGMLLVDAIYFRNATCFINIIKFLCEKLSYPICNIKLILYNIKCYESQIKLCFYFLTIEIFVLAIFILIIYKFLCLPFMIMDWLIYHTVSV